jgi:hypothetical protein
MSNIIEFRYELNPDVTAHGVGTLDGATTIEPQLQLPMSGFVKMQVNAITISDRIPNFFNAAPFYEFDNTIFRVEVPTHGMFDVVIPRGLYNTVDQVAAAINDAINTNLGWWTNPLDPGLTFIANTISDKVIIAIDSTKLMWAGAIFILDMRKTTTGTSAALTLGFTEASALLTGVAGTTVEFVSNQYVRMDTQGTTCDIQSNLISQRKRNSTQVRTLALVPFAGKNTTSDNIWPSAGQISPILVYEGGRSIKYWNIEVKTLNGLPMLFMGGAIHVVVSFIY